MLIVLSGLPGTGKTTLARALALLTGVVHLRIDSIEQALRESGQVTEVNDAGYRVAYAVAADNLRLGRSVIADSVNPIEATRSAWHAVAQRAHARVIDVELVCSDAVEHRRRVESRVTDIEGLRLPTWQQVLDRDYEAWARERIAIDTAVEAVADAASRLAQLLPVDMKER